jgi:hypothetical protein
MTNTKQTVFSLLKNIKQIHLPEISNPEDLSLAPVLKQKAMFIEFDDVKLVDARGSIVDFIITKGSGEVLVCLNDGWLKLTDQQRSKIESAGKSFVVMRTDLTNDWHSTICYGSNKTDIKVGPFGVVESYTKTTYWVYHNKWGWQNGAQ